MELSSRIQSNKAGNAFAQRTLECMLLPNWELITKVDTHQKISKIDTRCRMFTALSYDEAPVNKSYQPSSLIFSNPSKLQLTCIDLQV